ncbi:SURF1 family cytochrome oxidase biogenesis protein [Kineococcus gypseus]|uniref:SURF1 family cytochrome oxidase biogenesis protein n=1 Tax=Kineococcus gypseus TaxID=1637102 RepID=UPI003D7D419D
MTPGSTPAPAGTPSGAGGSTSGDPAPAGSPGAPPAGARAVLGLLREPGWRRGLALAVAVAVVCVLLGQWQWHRRQDRLAANGPLVGNYDAAPVPLDAVLPASAGGLDAADAWTPVRVSGTYAADATVLVRNRLREGASGYLVLVPLVLGDGTALLVDRGWVPAGSSTRVPDAVPAPPAGVVGVTARVRPWEAPRRADVPAGQVASIAAGPVGEVTAAAGAPALRAGYAVLEAEEPAPAVAPASAVRPEVDEGPHLGYTVQWYGFALTSLVVWVVAGRRELQARALAPVAAAGPPAVPDADGSGSDGSGGAGAGAREPGAPGPAGGAAPARPRRGAARPARRVRAVRPGSDEEAEDSQLDAGGAQRVPPGR